MRAESDEERAAEYLGGPLFVDGTKWLQTSFSVTCNDDS